MSKTSHQDVNLLQKTIDELKEQKERVENKFRDLTHAYKSILAEKKALEITIKALKTKTPSSNNNLVALASSGLSNSSKSISSDLSEHETIDKNINNSSKAEVESTEQSNDAKIAALTANIQLLLDSKSKMETNYQAEKKKLLTDLNEVKSKYDSIRSDSENNETKLKELRVSLKQSQLEREKLSQDLSTLLKSKSSEQESKIMSLNEENQQILFNLRNENNELKQKIKNLNKQFDNKCEQVLQSENELKLLKKTYDEQLKIDEHNMNDLRNQLRDLTSSSERRITDLESNICQLCSTIANYENNSKISGLVNTPKFLNSFGNSNNSIDSGEKSMGEYKMKNYSDTNNSVQSPQPSDIDSAIEQITQLKRFVETKAKDLNIDFNFSDIWSQNTSSSFNLKIEKEKQKEMQTQIDNLKEENRTLREEYEKCKIRTNYLIKSAKQASSSTSSTNYENELKKMKQEIDNLKMKVVLVEREKSEEIQKLKTENDAQLSQLRNDYKLKIDKLEQHRLKCMSDLEKELAKQRERTFKLLAEKDSELNKYKHNNYNNLENDSSSSSPSLTHESENVNNDKIVLNDETTNSNSIDLIYYSQQNAYKDSELNRLRQSKINLEYKIKQIQDENTVESDRYQSQINLLKQEIERLKLNMSRVELNGANFEYIKNVVFNYMTAKDSNIKLNLTNSLVQILHFTKAEKQKVEILNGSIHK